MEVVLEGVSSFRESKSVLANEIQGKHIQGTAFGEQQLGPITHANAAPN